MCKYGIFCKIILLYSKYSKKESWLVVANSYSFLMFINLCEENKYKLERLIQSYANMISEYEDYKDKDESSDITISGTDHPVLSPAVASIVTYFTMNKFYLASELLTYAKELSDGGEYEPYSVNNVRSTTEYSRLRREIINSGREPQSGTSNFEKGSSIADKDLYYAIHGYSYDYESGLLTITDYYDFAYNKDYDGIAGTAVNTMYMAQLLGVIIPYDVRIELLVN